MKGWMDGRGGDIRAVSSDAPPSKVQTAKKSKQNNEKPMAKDAKPPGEADDM